MEKFPRKDEVIANLTVWLSISVDKNYSSIVGLVVDKVINDISNYIHCDVSEIPEELDMTIVSMCTQFINTHELLKSVEDRNDGVTSLSEGDISVSFKTPADIYTTIQSVNTITDNFVAQLNNFRRVQR